MAMYPNKERWQRFGDIDDSDLYKYSTTIVTNPELQPLWKAWKANLEVPFHGITCDGRKQEGLYVLRDEVQAARTLLQVLSPSEKSCISHSLDSEDWRKWMNPEFMLFKCGLRLEDLEEAKIESIMNLVQSSLRDKGFDKVRGAMKTNKFLGELCHKKAILNEYSYFFVIFGEPSETESWSYMLFGHHLALNVFIARQQMVVGPVFLGAEPSRHLAGAFQDNRVIPYEGVLATDMTIEQRELLLSIISSCTLLPPGPLEFRLADIREHLSETYFCWIGGFSSTDPFYYRIQSPVTLFEFDHHSGVFLTNDEPAKYHIHTIQRLPNGNDYG
ncbi:hypothetical protein CGCA056_v000277 [Colletotrichum aenigma]|uniref:uncharacterized protein n=1 Tax=Colletotrichum aenigma TaxID=1215731 RepID=UPI0018722E75|nr:uncharacterized protein CGCA056_v000277 [Colletotrichum aenigma]KAF5528272.1 hypothetical protein CGCA056_v000277 [Colletotrichum aenigma]